MVSKKDHKKVARKRRQRGYTWEDTIVKRFNALADWKAFRLGSPSVNLPDILAVNSKNKSLYVIEAKSGTTMSLRVPSDQLQRCKKWINTFDLYENRKVILAFKFLAKKRMGPNQYESRQLREYYKEWDDMSPVSDYKGDLVCTYEGRTYVAFDGSQQEDIILKDDNMPFLYKKPNPSLVS